MNKNNKIMAEDKINKVIIEKIKIDDEEFTAGDLLDNFSSILDFFRQAPVTTPVIDKFNKFIDMLWRRKNYDSALLAIEEAEKKFPGDRKLVEKRGEILIDAGKFDEALELLLELMEIHPDQHQYLEYIGRIYHNLGELEEAKNAYLEALQNSTKDPTSLMSQFDIMEQLARIYYEKEDYPMAMEYLEEILAIHPRSSKWRLYFRILKKMNLEQELEKSRTVYKQIKKGRRYHSRAAKYEKQNKIELALKNYKKAADANPYEPQYYFCVGNVLEKLPEDEYEFQFDEATGYYKKAIELYPNNIFYIMALVGNLSFTRDWEEAYEFAAEAGRKFPEFMLPSLRELSFVLGRESNYMELLREYIGEDTKKRKIELRSELAIMLRERKKEEADDWFREALELYEKKTIHQPYSWRSYWDIANCQLELEEIEKARGNLEYARELCGEFNEDIVEKLVEVYYQLDHFEKAKELLMELIPKHPDDYEYYGKLGMIFLFELDYDKGFEAFNRSLLLNRYVPEYLYGAAVCAARLGKHLDAIDIIKDLLEMEPGFLQIIQTEDTFLEVKETKEFLQMLHKHKADRRKPAKPLVEMKKFILKSKQAKLEKELN
ncbi:MAG: tetratricopeptide repeat protein [Candidatus Eremiobacteraeota bacterium]|nr:tetratricopeptide repeat protein [Candidatus Eremiobacteraeota bacterium]